MDSTTKITQAGLVANLMSNNVITCSPWDDLEQATRTMLAGDVDCIPVIDGQGRLIGVITPRDICSAVYALERPVHALTVEQAMRDDPATVGPEDGLARAERLMQIGRLRELPVVDRAGHLLGLLEIDDLL